MTIWTWPRGTDSVPLEVVTMSTYGSPWAGDGGGGRDYHDFGPAGCRGPWRRLQDRRVLRGRPENRWAGVAHRRPQGDLAHPWEDYL